LRYSYKISTVIEYGKKKKIDDVLSALLKFVVDTLKPQEGEFTRVNPV